jgi:hypothetical protein
VASLSGPARTLRADDLEIAVLEHGPWRRTFRRVDDHEVTELLKDGEPFEQAASSAAEGEPAAGSLDPSGDKTGDVTTGDAQLD